MFAKSMMMLACAGLAATMLFLDPSPSHAAGGGDGDAVPAKFDGANQAIEEGNYQKAIDELMTLHREEPKDADVLNLLGYSHRKLGHMDEAREYYLQALAIEPGHRGANEYLGELYLEVGDLAKAEERLAVLDDECFFPCSEYSELKAAVNKYKTDNGVQ